MSFPTTGPIPGSAICDQYGLTPDEFSALPPNLRMLFRMAYAADVMKVHEDGPPHTNHGPEVNRVLGICGWPGGGQPWCIAQPSAYLIDSGVPRSQLPPNLASTHSWLSWAEENGHILEVPVRGCIGLLIFSSTEGHGFAVSNVDRDAVLTLEGNSNTDGSRDGWEDVRHRRPISSVHAFVDTAHFTSA